MGRWTLSHGGKELRLPMRKAQALLAYLILENKPIYRRDALANLLWSNSTTDRARLSLRQAIFEIKKAVHAQDPRALTITKDEIVLDHTTIWTDIDTLMIDIEEGKVDSSYITRIIDLAQICPGAEDLDPQFGEWITGYRTRIADTVSAHLERVYSNTALPAKTRLGMAKAASTLDEFNETAVRAQMTLNADLQQAPTALLAYRALYERLDDELGTEPSAETQDLAVKIKLMDPAPSVKTTPPTPAKDHDTTVAVLPFEALSDQDFPAYMLLGLLDEITCHIASFTAPAVVSGNSTRQYLGQTPDPKDVGQKLSADYVVTGRIRTQADRTYVTVEVIDAVTGRIIQSKIHSCASDDIFSVNSTIAQNIASAVVPSLHAAELARIQTHDSGDLAPFHLLLRARELMFEMKRAPFFEAGDLLAQAIKRGPYFAPAHALLAEWYSICIWQGWSNDPRDSERALEASARRAISLSNGGGRAMALLGHNRVILNRQYDEALRLFDRALEALPNDAETLIWTVPSLAYTGHTERAVQNGRRALTLSPYDPFMFRNQHFLSVALYADGQFNEAADLGLCCFETNPTYGSNLRMTIASLTASDRLAEAAPLIETHETVEPRFRIAPFISKQAFRDEEARKLLGDRLACAGLLT